MHWKTAPMHTSPWEYLLFALEKLEVIINQPNEERAVNSTGGTNSNNNNSNNNNPAGADPNFSQRVDTF